LLEPFLDEVLGIDLDRFDLPYRGESNDDPANHDSVARYSETLEGPTITQELGSKVPLLRPIRFQALSSFVVSDARAGILFSEKIESASVGKGIS